MINFYVLLALDEPMHIIFLCLCVAIGVLSFAVVLNSAEQPSRLYPGSNVRFLASIPAYVALIIGLFFLFPDLQGLLAFDIYSILWLLLLVLFVVAHTVYCAWVEYKYQAGLGKSLLKAIVVDKAGKPLTMAQALKRNTFKLLLLPLAPISLYIMIKDFRKQTLHDKLSDTFVMWPADIIDANQPQSSYEVNIS